jgi:hypothetical protein
VSVDVTLSTTEYVRVPAELSGESVPPGQVKVINLNERAPRRDRLSVSVRSRSGLLIAEVVQTFSKDNLEFNLSSGEGGDGKVDKEEIGEQPVKRQAWRSSGSRNDHPCRVRRQVPQGGGEC